MYKVVKTRFDQHPDKRDMLIATDDAELIEGNNWGDREWGAVKNEAGEYVGENKLGKILMQIREEYCQGEKS